MDYSDEIIKLVQSTQGNVIKILHSQMDISNDFKEEVARCASQWAQNGGVLPPEYSSIPLKNPPNICRYNKNLSNYLKEFGWTSICGQLQKCLWINQQDVKEFQYSIKHKKYKTALMYLFSFIDSIILNSQDYGTEEKARKVLPSKTKQILPPISSEMRLFYKDGQIICSLIEEYYKAADNFKNEKIFLLPNRNFIMHGMSNRKITRLDCLKLSTVVLFCYNYFYYSLT